DVCSSDLTDDNAARARCAASAGSRPLSTSFVKVSSSAASAEASACGFVSNSRTAMPACANSWAMPRPIAPLPTMPTCWKGREFEGVLIGRFYPQPPASRSASAACRPALERLALGVARSAAFDPAFLERLALALQPRAFARQLRRRLRVAVRVRVGESRVDRRDARCDLLEASLDLGDLLVERAHALGELGAPARGVAP